MTVVLEASVALKWAMNEVDSDRSRRLRDDFRRKIDQAIAPDSCTLECAHGLSRAERRGIVIDPLTLWYELMAEPLSFVESIPLMPRALEIASRFRIGVYDCLYVALAEREKCDLITADMRLMNGLGSAFPFVRSLATYP